MLALIGLTLTFGAGIAMYSTMAEIKPMEYIIYAAVGLIVVFGLVRVVKNLKDEKKGLITEDELSQKIKLRAGANAFTASFYLWTMIMLFTLDSNISNEILLGIGIVGMGLTFVGFWLYHNNKDIDDGNTN
ncbi:MAG: hypothetical protein DRQ01_06375, partial [Ignavibacteriae bacterium]